MGVDAKRSVRAGTAVAGLAALVALSFGQDAAVAAPATRSTAAAAAPAPMEALAPRTPRPRPANPWFEADSHWSGAGARPRSTDGNRLAQAPADAAADAAQTPLGSLLAQARDRLQRGNAVAAYESLAGQELLYAGFAEFDFLLGLAAIEAGRPARAIYPLERVLAVDPGHLRARAEIARAHFLLGEAEAARREFETVSAQDIPSAVRSTIDRYLDAIDRLSTAQRPQTTAHLLIATGYDSNVNLGSSLGEWVAAGGLRLLPGRTSLANDGGFVRFGGSVGHVAPIDERWQWYARAAFDQRWNSVRSDVNLGTIDLTLGLGFREDCHRMSISAQLQHARLDDSPFRNAAGATAQWQCVPDAGLRLGGYAQVFQLLFPEQSVRDANRVQVGAFAGRSFQGARRPFVLGSVYAGSERSRRDAPEYSYDFFGLRLVSELTVAPQWRGHATLTFEHRSFDGVDPLFTGFDRTDRDLELRLGVERSIGNWSIAPTLVLTRVWSSIDPNDYRRAQAYLYARYRFD